jgi:nucleoside diphosphate kinase
MEDLEIIKRMLIETCVHNDLVIEESGSVQFSKEDGLEFYEGQRDWVQEEMANQLSSTELWAAIFHGREKTRAVLRRLRGSTDPSKAHWLQPGTISGLFGIGNMKELGALKKVIDNASHCSTSAKDGRREAVVVRRAFKK